MTSPESAATIKMLPYKRGPDIDYASLDFNPDVAELPPDAMEQNLELNEIYNLLRARFTGFDRRPDGFLDRETNICYNPSNLNVRIYPDIYLAFGVDTAAIRPRELYLPWEVGKPPDWALEIASESTGREDVRRKPGIYAHVGVLEYWRFDPTGGRYHGDALAGNRLVNGEYAPVELTTEPDGILKGYSPALDLYLCWDQGWPMFYDPNTNSYLTNWEQEREIHAETQRDLTETSRSLAAEQAAHRKPRTPSAPNSPGHGGLKRSCDACGEKIDRRGCPASRFSSRI